MKSEELQTSPNEVEIAEALRYLSDDSIVHKVIRRLTFERDSLRQKLAAAPAWHRKPTCAGWWLWATIIHGEIRNEPGLCGFCRADENTLFNPELTRWYGPIPDAP